MDTMQAIKSRKSVRTFNGKLPTESQMRQIIEAANASPVGLGRYGDMHLTVVTDKAALDMINGAGAKVFGREGADLLYGAPMLVIVSTTKDAIKTMANVAYSNAAGIVQNMALAAVDLGVGACHIWGAIAALPSDRELCDRLSIPDGFVPCCALALGQSDYVYTERDIPSDRISINTVS